MNNYTQHSHGTPKPNPKAIAKKRWGFSFILNGALIIAIGFTAFVLRIHLNDKTEKLNTQARMLRKEIQEKNQLIQTMKTRYAELCAWSHINKKIKQYNLGLRSANYEQVHQLKRNRFYHGGDTSYSYASNKSFEPSQNQSVASNQTR